MTAEKSEILIIGAGIAGIVTALELLEQGKQVRLIDRDQADAIGGQARESFGGIFFVDSPEQRRRKIKDTPQLALSDWHSFAEFGAADILPKAWAEAYVQRCTPDVSAWLRGFGIGFLPMPIWIERGEFKPGNSVPRFHVVWGTGRELVDRLLAALNAHPRRKNLTLEFGRRVERLIVEQGRVCGCSGQTEEEGRPFELRADCVVVAAGGINGDLERVKANWHADWGQPPEKILNGSHQFADGRVHDAVSAAGGRVTHLDKMWNYASGVHHWRPRRPLHGLSLIPPKSPLWLNWRGQRIGPQPLVSGFDTRRLVSAICAQERKYSWQVLNTRIALRELAVSGAEFNPSIREKSWPRLMSDMLFGNRWLYKQLTENCIDFVTARSLPELVQKMNALQGDMAVELEAVSAAVAAYDANVTRGKSLQNDEQLRRIAALREYVGDRLRIAKSQRILDPDAMPLIAIREFIVSRKSLGGIQTDLECRVVGNEGAPIDGLYAVGEAAGFGGGGVHGLRALEGTFLGNCIFTGRVAAHAIAGKPLY
jgi:predicted oxidoreductase